MIPFVRLAVVGSLALPLAGVYALVAREGHHWPHANALTWYAAAVVAALALARRRGLGERSAGVFLAVAAFNLFVLTPEVGLRLAGFRDQAGIEIGAGVGGDDHPSRFVRLAGDGGRFWILPPDTPGVNAQGFATGPLADPADTGTVRVVFLGDSLAFQGYPEIAETLLNAGAAEHGRRYRVLNLSLAGYSSEQGRAVVERHGADIDADLAAIGYGWNDHWLAWGAPDAERAAARQPATPRLAAAVFHHSRLAQAARFLVTGGGRRRPGPGLRVPPERFRANLLFLGGFFAARGARPLLLTLPSAHHRLGFPERLIETGLASDAASAVALHRDYAGIVREVAAERGWALLDLERELAPLGARELAAIFTADGIHLTTAGLALVAQRAAHAIPAALEAAPAGGGSD